MRRLCHALSRAMHRADDLAGVHGPAPHRRRLKRSYAHGRQSRRGRFGERCKACAIPDGCKLAHEGAMSGIGVPLPPPSARNASVLWTAPMGLGQRGA
jgi:hypothetical protein